MWIRSDNIYISSVPCLPGSVYRVIRWGERLLTSYQANWIILSPRGIKCRGPDKDNENTVIVLYLPSYILWSSGKGYPPSTIHHPPSTIYKWPLSDLPRSTLCPSLSLSCTINLKKILLSSLRGHFLLLMYPPPTNELLMGTLVADLYQVVPFSSAKPSNQVFMCIVRRVCVP